MRFIHIITGLLISLSSAAQAGIIDEAERFWAFDGSYSDSVANIGGSSIGGALFGNDRDGNAGSALVLDGVNDSILVNSSTDLAVFSDYSLSLWFKMDQHNVAGRTYLFDSRAPGSTSNSYIYIDRDSGSNENLYSFNNYTSHSTLDDNNWHNIIFTNSNSSSFSKTYLDGVQISHRGSISARNFNGGLTFGSWGQASGTNYWLNGQLDDIGLWNKSLSVNEVSEIYNANASATSVPEPSTLAIFALGLMGLASRRFKKQ